MTRAMVFAFACSLAGCDENTCMQRGETASYVGTSTYDATPSAPGAAGAHGWVETSVAVDDFLPWRSPPAPRVFVTDQCRESGMAFTLHVGDCRLWAHETATRYSGQGTRYSPSVFSYATAAVEADQSCDLPASAGNVTVTIASGVLELGPDKLELSLIASYAAWPGASPGSGVLHYDFVGY